MRISCDIDGFVFLEIHDVLAEFRVSAELDGHSLVDLPSLVYVLLVGRLVFIEGPETRSN